MAAGDYFDGVESLRDLEEINTSTGDLDFRVFPALKHESALWISRAQIACSEKALAVHMQKRPLGRGRIVPITAHESGAADDEFADFTMANNHPTVLVQPFVEAP